MTDAQPEQEEVFQESPLATAERLRDEVAKLKRQVQLKTAYGLHFYRPHWKQHLFHINTATGRYMRFGNRGGKSEGGISETLSFCLGYRPWYCCPFDIIGTEKVISADGEEHYEPVVRERHEGGKGHPYVTVGIPRRPVKVLLLVVDWDMAKKVFTNRTDDPKTCGKIFKLLPHEAIPEKGIHLSRGGHIDQIQIKRPAEFGGGTSTLTIDTIESWKHNRLGGESADWDAIHVDEPCPEDMFKSYARGLMDRMGRYWFNCTPLDQPWINEEFTPPGRQISTFADQGHQFDKAKNVTRYIITGSIFDNPHMKKAGIDEFMSTLTREEIACRIHGLPYDMAGAVYKEFIYDVHVLCDIPKGWKSYTEPPAHYTIRVAWDVHLRLPQALLFVATAPNGVAFVYDEMFFDSLIQANIDELKNRLTRYKKNAQGQQVPYRLNVCDQLIDPSACVNDPRDGSCILNDIMEADLYFQKASKDKTLGISRVRERLMERMPSTTPSALPTICFAPHLRETLFEFTHYVYDLDKNEPKDKDDHMMENLYRLVLNGLEYVAPVTDADLAHRRFTTIDHFEVNRNEFASNNLSL